MNASLSLRGIPLIGEMSAKQTKGCPLRHFVTPLPEGEARVVLFVFVYAL